MKSIKIQTALLSFALCAAYPACAAKPSGNTGFFEATQAYLDSFPGAYGEAARFHGAVLLVKDGKILFEYDDSGKDHATYEIGSTTKMMVAVAIMQLVEQGKLSLTQSIGSVLPEFAGKFPDVAIIHLLSHSSGISEYLTSQLLERSAPFSIDDIRSLTRQQKLNGLFGQHAYSNTNYLLLGLVIEKISGKPWQQYLKEHIYIPAGMLNTSDSAASAPLYYLTGGQQQSGEPVNNSLAFSAGALTSTPQDLQAFYQAFVSDKLISPASRKLMIQEVTPGSGYGLGVMSYQKENIRYLGHHGSTPTSRSRFVFDDNNRCSLIIFQTPARALELGPVEQTLLDACQSNTPPKPLAKKEAVALSDSYREQLPGGYLMEPKALEIVKAQISPELAEQIKSLQVRLEDNQLIIDLIGQDAFPVEPLADGTLRFTPAQITIIPELKDGTVTGFTLRQPGIGLPYLKQ